MLHSRLLLPFLALSLSSGVILSAPSQGQSRSGASPDMAAQGMNSGPTYADLASLADGAPLVVRAQIRRQTTLAPERARNLAPGHARLYIEARTQALLSGNVPVGEELRYLVDVPLDARGKVPKLKKREVLLFARPVPGRPGELQLMEPRAQLLATPELESRLRPILAEFARTDVPPAITGVRDALSIEGTLVGESETQIFLETPDGAPASLTIVRRPNQPARWGASFGEIVDQSARPPQPQTLAWYRLACGLPDRLPITASLSDDPQDQARAARDYALVREQLGECRRTRS